MGAEGKTQPCEIELNPTPKCQDAPHRDTQNPAAPTLDPTTGKPYEPVYITEDNIEEFLAREYGDNEEAKAQIREWFAESKKFVAACERCGLQTYADLESGTDEVAFIVEDFIPTKSVGILVAEWGIGKSPLAIQLQLSIMTGVKFLGMFAITKPGQALFVDLEGSKVPTREVAVTLSHYIGADRAYTGVMVYGANYSDELGHGNIEYLQEMVRACKPKLVIIDPIRVFDKNAQQGNDNAVELINSLRKIAVKEDCSILFVHHPHKTGRTQGNQPNPYSLDGDDPTAWMECASGAAALVQNVDFRIGIERKKEDELTLRYFVKMYGWSKPLTLIRDRDPETDLAIGYRTSSPLDNMDKVEKTAFESLGNEFTSTEADQALNVSRNTTLNRLREWQERRLIKMGKQGKHRKIWKEPVGTAKAASCL